MRKKLFKIGFGLLILLLISLFSVDYWVKSFASDKCSFQLSKIKSSKIGLLLGTSKYTKSGKENLYYNNRIDAAVKLFMNGKIKFILISGDNSSKEYNEPQMMKNDLMLRGVPASKIYLDYAGFRTLDSIERCKEVFGEADVIVISQKFHNERAIFLADSFGIKMQGFNAKDVKKYFGFMTAVREKFARLKLLFDLATGKKSKYLGNKIKIE